MKRFTESSLPDYLGRMGERHLPTPAAGSGLGVTLSIAVTLLLKIERGLIQREKAAMHREALLDFEETAPAWAEEALRLADLDSDVVYRMWQAGFFEEGGSSSSSSGATEDASHGGLMQESLEPITKMAFIALLTGQKAYSWFALADPASQSDLKVVLTLTAAVLRGVTALQEYNMVGMEPEVQKQCKAIHYQWKEAYEHWERL